MSEPLSQSTTFQALQARVTTLEGGPAFAGPITVPKLLFDAAFSLAVLGGNPTLMVDPSSSIAYNRSTKKFLFFVDGIVVASIDASGNLKIKGALTQNTTP